MYIGKQIGTEHGGYIARRAMEPSAGGEWLCDFCRSEKKTKTKSWWKQDSCPQHQLPEEMPEGGRGFVSTY